VNPRIIKDFKLLPHQRKVFESNAEDIIFFAGRGAGKTFLASRYISKYLVEGKNVIVAAQTFRILKKVLFREILNCLTKWGIRFKVNQTDMTITTEFKSEAHCFTYSEGSIDSVRGLTGISLVVIDEAALMDREFYEVCMACCRGVDNWGRPVGAPHSLLISTPKAHSYLNQRIKEALPGEVELITATTMDNTTLDKRFIERLVKDYGNTSFLKQEIYAELIDDSSPDQLISWMDIEDMCKRTGHEYGDRILGIDLARYGDDNNSCWYRHGTLLRRDWKINSISSIDMYNKIAGQYKPWDLDMINLDGTGGFSSGVADLLRHGGYPVTEVNFGQRLPEGSKYLNRRALMYAVLEAASRSNLALTGVIEDLDKVKEELAAQKIILRETDNKIALLSKDIIKKALGRSPDDSDGIALTFAHVTDLEHDIYKTFMPRSEEPERNIFEELNRSHRWAN